MGLPKDMNNHPLIAILCQMHVIDAPGCCKFCTGCVIENFVDDNPFGGIWWELTVFIMGFVVLKELGERHHAFCRFLLLYKESALRQVRMNAALNSRGISFIHAFHVVKHCLSDCFVFNFKVYFRRDFIHVVPLLSDRYKFVCKYTLSGSVDLLLAIFLCCLCLTLHAVRCRFAESPAVCGGDNPLPRPDSSVYYRHVRDSVLFPQLYSGLRRQ